MDSQKVLQVIYLCNLNVKDMETSTSVFLQDEELSILSKIAELRQDLEAIYRVRNLKSTPIDAMQIADEKERGVILVDDTYKPFPVPDSYNKDINTWEERCVFALNQLGRADVEMLIEKIREYEPEVSYETIKNVATNKMSKLYKQNRIKADTSKKRYIYYL